MPEYPNVFDIITGVIVSTTEGLTMTHAELTQALKDFEADFRYLEAILLQARKAK